MKKKPILTLIVVLAAAVLVALFCTPATAKVTGVCSSCHTMHYSQGGADPTGASGGPSGALLLNNCVGCHTGTNTGSNTIPYVYKTSEPVYGTDGTGVTSETLAGGSFYWVASTSAKGHNVDGIATFEMDPPGYPGADRGRPASWGSTQLTCAGTYGCHGDPTQAGSAAGISGAHHGSASFGNDYRWLEGIAGLECNSDGNKWEYRPTAAIHNQYKGVDRTVETGLDTTTISSLCGQCHGNFHYGSGNLTESGGTWGSGWVRHPTDYDMGNTGVSSEYRSYNGGGATPAYSVSAPVASLVVTTVKSTVSFADDTIVMCLSCHRAHGTPNNDLLRWEYTMNAGSGTDSGGCFVCHTTKDDL